MRAFLCIIALGVAHAAIPSKYYLGKDGESCSQTCFAQGLNCNTAISTNNTDAAFQALGVTCKTPASPTWRHQYQPAYTSDPSSPTYGECVGYEAVPNGVQCSGQMPGYSRLCLCDQPSTSDMTFGTSEADAKFESYETHVFSHVLAPGDFGVMTHLWITYVKGDGNTAVIRYYVDGETVPSIVISPSLAAGTGFNDETATWGSKWFSKGAAIGAWSWNLRVPFNSSIRVTAQHEGSSSQYWFIVRGVSNVVTNIGGIPLPRDARLVQTVTNATFGPLDFVPMSVVPQGKAGFHFMTMLSVETQSPNFVEGCMHMYTPDRPNFPGILISSGMEDYFDSAWGFDSGVFHLPNAGLTHQERVSATTPSRYSMYRVHEMDPLQFNDGMQLVWRNGDMRDASGYKCNIMSGGGVVGNPAPANVTAYGWAYAW